MGSEFFLDLTNQAVKVTIMVASPMLIGALIMGILVSLLQAVTQINEQTLSFIPKILIIMASLIILGPWMVHTITDYTTDLFTNIPSIVASK